MSTRTDTRAKENDRIPEDDYERLTAREALEFARELRESHYDDPAERERVLAGVGRLVRWADERVR